MHTQPVLSHKGLQPKKAVEQAHGCHTNTAARTSSTVCHSQARGESDRRTQSWEPTPQIRDSLKVQKHKAAQVILCDHADKSTGVVSTVLVMCGGAFRQPLVPVLGGTHGRPWKEHNATLTVVTPCGSGTDPCKEARQGRERSCFLNFFFKVLYCCLGDDSVEQNRYKTCPGKILDRSRKVSAFASTHDGAFHVKQTVTSPHSRPPMPITNGCFSGVKNSTGTMPVSISRSRTVNLSLGSLMSW